MGKNLSQNFTQLLSNCYVREKEKKKNPPDSIQHQSHERNTQQEHVEEQRDPLECLTKDDQEKYGASPACV